MKLGFLTDPHIGINRLANTTIESRRRFRKVVYLRTLAAIAKLREEMVSRITLVGDLFDTYANDEATIAQGAEIIAQVDDVLAGNHDIKNDVEVIGSLQLLAQLPKTEISHRIIGSPNPGSAYAYRRTLKDDTQMVYVPHCLNQEIFEASLDMAAETRTPTSNPRGVLCLHCNIGIPGEAIKTVTAEGTSLHLTDEKRKMLEDVYDLIVVGHEHPPRRISEKTVVLGNIMPLTFGEMDDRYVWTYDTKTRELKEHEIFSHMKECALLGVEEVLDAGGGKLAFDYSYIDVQGPVKHTDVPALYKAIASLWKNNPSALMIRNNTEVIGAAQASRDNSPSFIPKTLPELVGEAVRDTPHKAAYDESVAAVAEEADSRGSEAPARCCFS